MQLEGIGGAIVGLFAAYVIGAILLWVFGPFWVALVYSLPAVAILTMIAWEYVADWIADRAVR